MREGWKKTSLGFLAKPPSLWVFPKLFAIVPPAAANPFAAHSGRAVQQLRAILVSRYSMVLRVKSGRGGSGRGDLISSRRSLLCATWSFMLCYTRLARSAGPFSPAGVSYPLPRIPLSRVD